MIKQDISEKQAKKAFLAIGSNLGNKIINIEKDTTKPKYINIVIKVKTTLSPINLLKLCNKIEFEIGRKRFGKNEPRVCDIDIIDYDQKIIRLKKPNDLIIPHPRMKKRNFVLLPLYEIAKNWKHPVNKVNIAKLISFLNDDDLRTIKQI